jgi:hypothetical protein
MGRSALDYDLGLTLIGADKLAERLSVSATSIRDLQAIVRKYTVAAQKMAVQNVSGGVVTYSKGTFTIQRMTGKLARSIQASYPNAFSGVVTAGAEYAADVEQGTRGPVDMKPFLMGKTVPLPVAGAIARAATRWSKANGGSPTGFTRVQKIASTGKLMGSAYIAFRKVGPNSKGWIIPQQPARPFMQATAEKIEPLFRADVEAAWARFIEGNVPLGLIL